MRIEIFIILVTGAIIANIYTEGRFFKKVMSYRKYYEMSGVIALAYFVYYVIKKNPRDSQKLILTTNEYIKYLPIDKNASDIITPILNFTSQNPSSTAYFYDDNDGVSNSQSSNTSSLSSTYFETLRGGGGDGEGDGYGYGGGGNEVKISKRSVSETKKKFVAARQNWRCLGCNNQLNAWFEIDHNIRLEYGGSNHVDNLSALCRECHGKKTTIENL